MDSLQHILAGFSDGRSEPPEIKIIKNYVLDEFEDNVQVVVREKEIIIACPSAALASSLRMRTRQLKNACQTDKRFVFKIG